MLVYLSNNPVNLSIFIVLFTWFLAMEGVFGMARPGAGETASQGRHIRLGSDGPMRRLGRWVCPLPVGMSAAFLEARPVV